MSGSAVQSARRPDAVVTVFLCGDVMTGRGVDQILPSPGDPVLHESWVDDARTYVALAERANGPIPHPVDPGWPWGQALPTLDEWAPDVRVINLETAITAAAGFAPGKAVHYRMSPGNIGCLTRARPDACVLANNHVLDFGRQGLTDTLSALSAAGLGWVGAGRDADEARRPLAVAVAGARVLVFAYALASSGVPADWAVTAGRPGVSYLDDLSEQSATQVIDRVRDCRRPGDIVVVSLHWGSNWGYRVGPAQVRFAHQLVDAGVDIVHGHSSHHPRPIEVYHDRLILYGCGDLIDDYEGIAGHQRYRNDLRLLYIASVDPDTGTLVGLQMMPMRVRRMRLEHSSGSDTEWLQATLEQSSRDFATRIDLNPDGTLALRRT